MKTSGHTHWTAALGLHLACAYAYVGWVLQRVHPAGALDPGEGGVEIGVGRAGSYTDVAERNAASQEPDETARKGEPETKERPPATENAAATAPNRNVSRVASADGAPVVMETPDCFAVPVDRGGESNQTSNSTIAPSPRPGCAGNCWPVSGDTSDFSPRPCPTKSCPRHSAGMPPGTATGHTWTIRSCRWTGRTSCCAQTCPRRSSSANPTSTTAANSLSKPRTVPTRSSRVPAT